MSYLIKRVHKYRLQFCLLVVAILALVIGLPFIQLTEEAEANNPDISEGIFISGPSGDIYDHDNPNSESINMGDSTLGINIPEGGSVTATVNGAAATVTRDGQSVSIDIPAGSDKYLSLIHI